MPCIYEESPDEKAERIAKKKAEWDRLTRIACNLAKRIDEIGLHEGIGDLESMICTVTIPKEEQEEIVKWWKQHKAIDEAREREEKRAQAEAKLKQQALSKLSKKERKALGLDE